MTIYRKGDIIVVKFPFSNLTTFKPRPALVLSSDLIHSTGDILVVQITSAVRRDGLSFPLQDKDVDVPLRLRSYVRLHKIFVVEQQLTVRKISALKKETYSKVIREIISIIEWR